MSESSLGTVEGVVIVLLVVGYTLAFVVARLRRVRPGFRITGPLLAGAGVRLAAVAGIGASGLESQLRGGDEQTFLSYARFLADSPWGHGFLPHGNFELHTDVFAVQIKLADLSEGAMRITQVGIAMLGIILVAAAVHDLGGPRAARLSAWLLAFEPAGIFFAGALHKEPLMMLATGLVVFGGTRLWRRLDLYAALICALGCAVAVTTRDYAGWFLVSASVLLLLHAAQRRLDQPFRAMPIVYAVVLAGFLIAPTLTSVTSDESLERLQRSQTANAAGAGQGGGGANSSNLALEEVDFSTRSAVIRNLPRRIYDVSLRPYPWQLQNASQQLGAVGTLVAVGTLALLLLYGWRRRGRVLALAAPLIYPLVFLLTAYALSAGNAGTGFRYRTHLVMLALAVVAILRQQPAPAAVAQAARTRAPAAPKPPAEAPAPGTVAVDWR